MIFHSPGISETGGIFGLNMNDESLPDAKETGINIKSDQALFTAAGDKDRIEVIDWAKSQIFQMVLDGDISLNREKDNRFFQPEEVEYVVQMMKKRYKDFKTNDMLKPFFKKGKNTLKMLMDSLEVGKLYNKIDQNYNEITLENSFKILIRCKMLFEARETLKVILEDLAAYEIILKDVFEKVERHLESSTDEEERDELRRKGETLSFYTHRIVD